MFPRAACLKSERDPNADTLYLRILYEFQRHAVKQLHESLGYMMEGRRFEALWNPDALWLLGGICF